MPALALVVDDSMLIRHTICRFLEERGFSVALASNGREALALLERARPDFIVTDMDMPVMGGTEFITALKERTETAAIPIVIVASRASGLADKESRAEFVIFKDIDIVNQLQRALETLAASSAKRQASGN